MDDRIEQATTYPALRALAIEYRDELRRLTRTQPVTLDELRAVVRGLDDEFEGIKAGDVSRLFDFIGQSGVDDAIAHVSVQRAMRGIAHMKNTTLNEQTARQILQDDPRLLAMAAACWIDGYAAATLLSKGSQA